MEFSREERLDSATVSERERSLALALLSADGSAEYAHHFMGWTLQRKDGKLQQRVLVVGQFRLSTRRYETRCGVLPNASSSKNNSSCPVRGRAEGDRRRVGHVQVEAH